VGDLLGKGQTVGWTIGGGKEGWDFKVAELLPSRALQETRGNGGESIVQKEKKGNWKTKAEVAEGREKLTLGKGQGDATRPCGGKL